MSSTLTENTSLAHATAISGPSTPKSIKALYKIPISPWMWLAITCAILSVSGGIRFWKERQFRTLARQSLVCPFPLSELPQSMGTWQAEGVDQELDRETSQLAGGGSSASLVRVYRDRNSGQTARLYVLYGASHSVFSHNPDVCYPANGFSKAIPFVDRKLATSSPPETVAFRASFFKKDVGGLTQYIEAFCTFRYNGQWLTETASGWKTFRAHPSMFKIQIERVTSGLTTENSPMDSLLQATVAAIDGRLEAIDARQNEKQKLAGANAKSVRH
jgi:hypothetical protein